MPDTPWRAGDVVRLCGGTIVVYGPNDVENRWINVSEVDVDGESLEFLEDYQVEESGPVLLLRDGLPVFGKAESGYSERAKPIVRTVIKALLGVGVAIDEYDAELYAFAVVDALEGIIPEVYYDD